MMKTRSLAPKFSILFVGGVVAYGAIGCASAPEAEDAQPSAAADGPTADEPVASLTESLYACGISYARTSPGTERFGCVCPAGMVRDYFNVWSGGNGSCHALGWASPDPNDCSVDVEIFPDASPGSTVYCTVTVDAKAPGSGCEGHCGGAAAGGECYCDEACTSLGDCCSDYVRVCTPAESCVNHCGGSALGGCYCDDACEAYGDCCDDHWAVCP